jgi:hypothetical protein
MYDTPVGTEVRGHRGVVPLVVALGIALALSLTWLLLPGGGSETISGSGGTGIPERSVTTSETLLEVEGPSVLLVLAVPVIPPAVALAARRRTVSLVLGWITLAFCVLAVLSLGVFYLPVAVLLLVAAKRQGPETG